MLPEIKEPVVTEPNSQTAVTSSDDKVDLYQATDEEVRAALRSAQEAERDSLLPDGVGTSESVVPDAQTSSPIPPDVAQPNVPHGTKVGVSQGGAAPTTPRQYTDQEIQAITAENERLKIQPDKKELLIQHLSNELGTLKNNVEGHRALKKQELAQLSAQLQTKWDEDPRGAIEDRDKIKALENEIASLDEQEERATRITEARTFFMRYVDVEKVTPDDLADVMRSDGVSEQFIAGFKGNPWEAMTPGELVMLGRRAMERKEYGQVKSDNSLLAQAYLAAQEEIKKLKARPAQVMQTVQRHLNNSPVVTANNGGASRSTNALNPNDVVRLSNSELKLALQEARRNESMH